MLNQDLPSPCISVCTVDEASGFCLGCARNIQEVRQWPRLDVQQRQAVLSLIPERKYAMIAAGADVRWRK